jgi:hypothetical protein
LSQLSPLAGFASTCAGCTELLPAVSGFLQQEGLDAQTVIQTCGGQFLTAQSG